MDIKFNLMFAFLISFIVGIALFYIIFVVVSFSTRKNEFNYVENGIEPFTKEELEEVIEDKLKKFKDKENRRELSVPEHLVSLLKQLVYEISIHYYPESKYPIAEISIDESLKIVYRATDLVDEILEGKFLGMFKTMRISKIMLMIEHGKIKAEKKAERERNRGLGGKILKAVNPLSLVGVVSKVSKDVAMNYFCKKTIITVGIEAQSIYSKTLFKESLSSLDVVEIESGEHND